MKKAGLRAKVARKVKATTNSNHTLPVAQKPNERWGSDITYIWTDEGWLYLAVVMDLSSRYIVGWSLSSRMTATLMVDALQVAIDCRGKSSRVIIHSDRGSQYCSSIIAQK